MATTRLWTVLLGMLALGGALTLSEAGAQEPQRMPPGDPDPDGVEVLTRGPIHEAYAEPVTGRPEVGQAIPKKPPEPIEEVPADQKPEGDDVQWLPGYWAWDSERDDYLWVSGFWRVPPPNRSWVPGHWNQAGDGWHWVPGFWDLDDNDEITYLPPPPDPVQAAASVPAPSAESVYVPGVWVYRTSRYVWRPGYWVDYRPGWVWVPAHYVWTPAGYVFVDGYWDYPLRERGILFAPVAFNVAIVSRPRFYYQPRYVVQDECLFGALFVRPGCRSYYFGDYFEPQYRRAGFTAWFEFRTGNGGCDPLYGYYRHQHRDRRDWDHGMRDLYASRYNGTAVRPPRTLVQQNNVVKNINVNNTTVVNNTTIVNNNIRNVNVKDVAMVAPITKLDKTVVKLQPVNAEKKLADQKAVKQMQEAAQLRKQQETKLLVKGPAPTKVDDAPRVVKVERPTTPVVKRTAPKVAPPPPPVKPEARAKVAVETKPPVKPEIKPMPVPAKVEPRPTPATTRPVDVKPVPKVEPKPVPKVDPKPEPKPVPKVEPNPVPKVEPKPIPKAEPRPVPKVEPKPIPKVELKPEPKVEPKPVPKVEPKPIPKAEPKPVPKGEPKPAPKVEPKPIPKAEPRPAPKIEPKPVPKVEPKTVAPIKPATGGLIPAPVSRSLPASPAKTKGQGKPAEQDKKKK